MAKAIIFEKTGQSNKVYRHCLFRTAPCPLGVSEVPKERKCFHKNREKPYFWRHAGELGKLQQKHIKGRASRLQGIRFLGNPQKWVCAKSPTLSGKGLPLGQFVFVKGEDAEGDPFLDAEVQRTGGAAGGKIPKGEDQVRRPTICWLRIIGAFAP